MDRSELEIIKELMAELEDKMQPGHEDFESRLGRQKPGVEVVKIEDKTPEDPALEAKEELMGKDLDGDMEVGEDPEHQEKVFGDEMSPGDNLSDQMSPEDRLKERLMKLRA